MTEEFAGFSAIAVAMDGSRLSESTLPITKEMARQFQSRISLITVLDPQVDGRFGKYARSEEIPLDEAVRAYLGRFVESIREEGLPVAGHVVEVRHGSTAETIREVAEHVNASILVIGSHGRSDAQEPFLGSTAEALISGGHIPVLVVRPTRAEAFSEL